MVAELEVILLQLDSAREPEDVFGRDARAAKAEYRRLVRVVHPDVAGGDPRAERAFRLLRDWWSRAARLLTDGTYGAERAPTVTVRTRKRAHVVVGRAAAKGDICDLFPTAGGDLFKVARHPRDNDLVQAEAATLRRLEGGVDDRWRPFLPDLVDAVGFRAGGGVVRRANVLRRLDGFVSLEEVAAAYEDGVEPRDMAWIWRRLLAVLGAAHRAGVVHGAVLPPHVMIHPEKHGVVLVDWAYAVEPGQRARAVVPRYRDWFAPELLGREPVGPEADVFAAARTMLYLLKPYAGSSTVQRDLLPKPLRAFFRACALDRRRRPDDAWLLQGTFDEVLERVYGPRRFRPFVMPTS